MFESKRSSDIRRGYLFIGLEVRGRVERQSTDTVFGKAMCSEEVVKDGSLVTFVVVGRHWVKSPEHTTSSEKSIQV